MEMKTNRTRVLALAVVAASFVLGGRAAAQACPNGCTFQPVIPCRVVDTRIGVLPNGGGPVTNDWQNPRLFAMRGNCGIPSNAVAVSVTLTAANPPSAGYLSIWPAGEAWPFISNLNFSGGESAVANGAVVKLGPTQGPDLACFSGTTSPMHVVIDVVGYFKP